MGYLIFLSLILLVEVLSWVKPHLVDTLNESCCYHSSPTVSPGLTGHSELLIKRLSLPESDNSWELQTRIASEFPAFQLADKLSLQGGGNDEIIDTHKGMIVYTRKKGKTGNAGTAIMSSSMSSSMSCPMTSAAAEQQQGQQGSRGAAGGAAAAAGAARAATRGQLEGEFGRK